MNKTKVSCGIAMSLDGFTAGVNQSSLDADLRPLNLNREEMLDLASFLESLSGEVTEAPISR
jgi:hypothetical protein